MSVTLSLAPELLAELLAHLSSSPEEQVAFLYCEGPSATPALTAAELYTVPPEGFLRQSAHHVALTDETRATVIIRAWQLGGALIEVHSHPGAPFAAFSPTDLLGFDEWVPHVRWRLRGAPYLALVFAEHDFDALAWVGAERNPAPVLELRAAEQVLRPSNLTISQQQR